jgi:hypothetical protein
MHPGITHRLIAFRDKKDVLALLTAVGMIVRQRRTLETVYGAYCNLALRPSPVAPCDEPDALMGILRHRSEFARPATLSRERIVELYGDEFQVSALPQDFAVATYESVRREGDRLVIGEYGEGSRLACVTPHSCTINTYYATVPGVRHIHSIFRYGSGEHYLVTTGDGAKVLDLWSAGPEGELRFVKRLRRRLAGLTAVANVGGEYYFGTDFSGRPNFIETHRGARYCFPAQAYRLFVSAFFVFHDRYIVSVNNALRVAGGARTLSVFDTVRKQFVFCDYLERQRPLE